MFTLLQNDDPFGLPLSNPSPSLSSDDPKKSNKTNTKRSKQNNENPTIIKKHCEKVDFLCPDPKTKCIDRTTQYLCCHKRCKRYMPIKRNMKLHQEKCIYNPRVIKEKKDEESARQEIKVKIRGATRFNCKLCAKAGVKPLYNFMQKKNVYDHINYVHNKQQRPPCQRRKH